MNIWKICKKKILIHRSCVFKNAFEENFFLNIFLLKTKSTYIIKQTHMNLTSQSQSEILNKLTTPNVVIQTEEKKFLDQTHIVNIPMKPKTVKSFLTQSFVMFRGTGTLHYVMDRAESLGHTCIFARDQNKKGIKSYGSFPTWDEFFKKYNNCITRNFYEVIRNNKPVLLYLDMEHFGEDIFNSSNPPKVCELNRLDHDAIKAVIFFLNKFLMKINRHDLIQSSHNRSYKNEYNNNNMSTKHKTNKINNSCVGSCSVVTATNAVRSKTSCHLVFHDLVFFSGIELQLFMQQFVDFVQNFIPLDEEEGKRRALLFYQHPKTKKTTIVIDPLVYHKNARVGQLFRLIDSCKYGNEDSRLNPLRDGPVASNKLLLSTNKTDFLKSLAQPIISKEQFEKAIRMKSSSLCCSQKYQSSSLDRSFEKKIESVANRETVAADTLELQAAIDSVSSLLKAKLNIDLHLIDVVRSTPKYIYINNKGCQRACPWADDGYHKSNNAFVTIEYGRPWFHCFASECSGKRVDLLDFQSIQAKENIGVIKFDPTTKTILSDTENNVHLVHDNKLEENECEKIVVLSDLVYSTTLDHPLRTKEEGFQQLVNYRQVKGQYLKRDLSHHLKDNERFQMIRSPTGTGKTKYMKKAFKKLIALHPEWLFVAVSPRCSVTQQHLKEFKSLGFVHYEEDKTNLDSSLRIITTLDSLVKINRKVDVIYIDEIESLLEHVFSSTLNGKRIHVWQTLLQICSHATSVICTDADFGDVSITFFTNLFAAIADGIKIKELSASIKPSEQLLSTTMGFDSTVEISPTKEQAMKSNALFLDNVQPLQPLSIRFCRSINQWNGKLEDALKNPSSKIFIGCDSRKAACNLFAQIKAWTKLQTNATFLETQLLLYTSEDGNKLDLNNVNSAWASAKVVICSPTIVYGVDYSNHDHPFTTVFGFYKQQGRTLSAEKIRQQLRRCRVIIMLPNQHFHIFVFIMSLPRSPDELENLNFLFPTTACQVQERLQQICSDFRSEIEKIIPVVVDGTGKIELLHDPLTELYIEVIRKRNLSKINLQQVLEQLLIFEKHHISFEPFPKKQTKKEKRESKHPIWNTEKYLTQLHETEFQQFVDSFDIAEILQCKKIIKLGLPDISNHQLTFAVKILQDFLGIDDFHVSSPNLESLIQKIKSSPFLLQCLGDKNFVSCIYKFRSLCAEETPMHSYGQDAQNVFVTQSDYALLAILQEVEESVLKMKRFECLFLNETAVRTLFFQKALISDHLLHLIHAVPQDKIPSSLSLDLFCYRQSSKQPANHATQIDIDANETNIDVSSSGNKLKKKNETHVNLYDVYRWVCKIYSHFCSSRLLKKKVTLIKSKIIKCGINPFLQNPRTQKDVFATQNIKICPSCHEAKNICNFQKTSLCHDCNTSITIYTLPSQHQFSVVQMMQVVLSMLFRSRVFQIERYIRLDEPIFQRFLTHSIDKSLNNVFQTYNCNTLQDIFDHYKNFSNFSELGENE